MAFTDQELAIDAYLKGNGVDMSYRQLLDRPRQKMLDAIVSGSGAITLDSAGIEEMKNYIAQGRVALETFGDFGGTFADFNSYLSQLQGKYPGEFDDIESVDVSELGSIEGVTNATVASSISAESLAVFGDINSSYQTWKSAQPVSTRSTSAAKAETSSSQTGLSRAQRGRRQKTVLSSQATGEDIGETKTLSSSMQSTVQSKLNDLKASGKTDPVTTRKIQSLTQLLEGRTPSAYEIKQYGGKTSAISGGPVGTGGRPGQTTWRTPDQTNGPTKGIRGNTGKTPETTPESTIQTVATMSSIESAMAILDAALAAGTISQVEYDLYSQTVSSWDPNTEVNFESVLSKFDEIKNSTIDPYFAQLIGQYQKDISTSKSQYESARALETESETANAEALRKSTQAGLESSGLTFTGKGVETLGGQSAFATSSSVSGIPLQELFNGGYHEGTTNQYNRLISSGSSARYLANLQALGRQSEDLLGSSYANSLGLSGFSGVGNVVGTVDQQKQQAYASTLSGLAGQSYQNYGYSSPLSFFD